MGKQSNPLRIESSELFSFITSRTINSCLWFLRNTSLETHVLSYLAKYQEEHTVDSYAYVMMGNHAHGMFRFPEMNRSYFCRDLNARFAEGVRRHVASFPGGPVFARRYAEQALARDEDVEEYFFYCALQPVLSGLCERIEDYPGYNSFFDAISGKKRKYRVLDWKAYEAARRIDFKVDINNFYKIYTLNYKRLPGYENLSQTSYKRLMLRKFETRRVAIIEARKAEGRLFMGQEALLKQKVGAVPKKTKTSARRSKRPLILTSCVETYTRFCNWYFEIYQQYKKAVKLYQAGESTYRFPAGTYRPPRFNFITEKYYAYSMSS